MQNKNSDRIKAVADKSYVEIVKDEQAYNLLSDLLGERLRNNLFGKESELQKQLKGNETSELAEKILIAPDQFYAAALMTKNKIFYGNGDFTKII